MISIAVAGAKGRMGRRILALAAESDEFDAAAGFDLPEFGGSALSIEDGSELVLDPSAAPAVGKADVLIVFTHANSCIENVRVAADAGKPVVLGTTGLSADQREELARLAQSVAIVFTPNMSIGVNLLFKLTGEVANVLGLDYNVEITEVHHNKKHDSPSGTALRLAEKAAEAIGLRYEADIVHGRHGMIGPRPQREIGMHALRGGDVVGEHTVSFIGQGERIELTHRAHNRDHFARGALIAARFVVTAKPGLYDMQDVLGLK